MVIIYNECIFYLIIVIDLDSKKKKINFCAKKVNVKEVWFLSFYFFFGQLNLSSLLKPSNITWLKDVIW